MSLGYRFAPVDLALEGHPRAWEAGPEAMGLWLWGMIHAKAHKTGGVLTRAATLGAWGGKKNAVLIERLVNAGLWSVRADGGWDIHNFSAKSSGSKSTERVKRFRERHRNGCETRFIPVSEGVTETGLPLPSMISLSGSDPVRDPLPASTRSVGPDGDSGNLFGAWAAGIRAVTGGSLAALSRLERQDVVDIANGHGGGRQGEALMVWMTDTATAWARQHDADYGGYAPKHCKLWLDAGRKPRKARAVPRQEAPAADVSWLNKENFDFGASK